MGYIQELTTRAAQGQPKPAIDLPVEIVPDPVEVFGTLEMRIMFPHNAISGIPYDDLVKKVFLVINGAEGFDLPAVQFGQLTLRREVHESTATPAAESRNAANVSGGVPETRHPIDSEHAGDSPVRAISIADEAGPGGVADQPHGIRPSPDFIGGLLQTARAGSTSGTRGDESDGSGEFWTGGPGRESIESASEEEDEEES